MCFSFAPSAFRSPLSIIMHHHSTWHLRNFPNVMEPSSAFPCHSYLLPAMSLTSRTPSRLLRTLTLELRLRARLVSLGSCGLSPLARANKLSMSVKLMTPVK